MTAGLRGAATATVVAGLVLASVAGCYPGDLVRPEESDLVLTFFDPSVSFDDVSTYAMPDSVVRFGSSDPADPLLDQQILDAIATEFAALGYTRVTATAATPPDAVVTVAVNVTEGPAWEPETWWAEWAWFPGWTSWYPEWGLGTVPVHPWPAARGGTRSAGTLTMTMLDPDGAGSSPDAIPVVWFGAVDGLFSGDDASVLSRFQGLIRQAFEASTYLGGPST